MTKILSTIRTAKAQRFENLISTGGNKKLPRPKLATTRGEKPRIIRLVVVFNAAVYRFIFVLAILHRPRDLYILL